MNRPITCRLRRLAAGLALTAAVAGSAIVAAAPAQAAGDLGTIGGNAPLVMSYAYNPETRLIGANCSSYTGTITILPYVNVQAGFVNGQWLTYRYQVRNRASGWWTQSGFAPAVFAAGSGVNVTYPLTPLAPSYYRPGIRADWEVLVQVAYWNGAQWLYAPWQLPSSGTSLGGSSSSEHCYT